MIDTLINRQPSSRTKYSPEIRQFCLRIHFHSPAAYNELRKFFEYRLPTCGTLRRYFRCVDASPGITQPALDEIAEKAKEYMERGERLKLCLISDDMAMRKRPPWNVECKTWGGFPTETNSKSKKELPVAKEALVFMAVAPNFRMPVAYFLIDGLQAVDRAVLTREVIAAVDSTGAKVVSLTGDGLSANVTVAKILGADFKSNKYFIPRPGCPSERIHIIFDPPHMLKLLRKYFAHHQLYYKGEKLKWNLLELLVKKQDNDNFELGNKLSRIHINFKDAPMKVSLAAETLSNSVADALEQLCEDQYEEFIGCEATVKFIRLCNNIFDIMNYGQGKPSDDHFKKPLCAENIEKFRELFQEFEEFVAEMEIDEHRKGKKNNNKPIRKPVLKSRSSMGFFGFLTNIQSTLGIYADYVESEQLHLFHTFQYSQDHLETYFSLIRACLGSNDNPDEAHLKAAYRKLLVCMPHTTSRGGNCIISSTDILTVSSAYKPPEPVQLPLNQIQEIEIDEGTFFGLLGSELEPYEEHIRAFIASNIQMNINKRTETKSVTACQDCWSVFNQNTKIHDGFLEKKTGRKKYVQPCLSTIEIIAACDVVFHLTQSKNHVEFDVMTKTIFSKLIIEELYESSVFDIHIIPPKMKEMSGFTHKEQFIYEVICEYMHMKSKKIGKRITIEEQNGRALRRCNRRNYIVAGQ